MFVTFLLLSALTGCFHKPARAALPPEPCQAELDAVQDATWDDAARKAVRGYLTCVVDAEARVKDVPGHVEMALKRNPYPATRRADIHGHFFDRELMKELPGSPAALPLAVELLEDQALALTAMGELDLAQAARGRAARLTTLARVLEDVAR